jgi:uroporphyrinogen III methyltransferase/synthase
VGSETAAAIAARGLQVDVVPEEFRAEAVAEAMRAAGIAGARVLLPRAAVAREILPVMLRAAGAEVDEVPAYETVAPRADLGELRDRLARRAVDLVTFTSSSTVRNFVALLGADAPSLLAGIRAACIGPVTADSARAAGLEVVVQPATYTIAAFTEAIVAFLGSTKHTTHHE